MCKMHSEKIGPDGKTFSEYYHLKEELKDFCRLHGLQVSGGKEDLNERILCYLETGQKITKKSKQKNNSGIVDIFDETLIGEDPIYSQQSRRYFEYYIGKKFSFKVQFQKWMKENPDKTYHDAVIAYRQITESGKTTKTEIGKQFEYNTYIRDFFADNKGRSLDEAIICWKFKKGQCGHNRYEKTDIEALK